LNDLERPQQTTVTCTAYV